MAPCPVPTGSCSGRNEKSISIYGPCAGGINAVDQREQVSTRFAWRQESGCEVGAAGASFESPVVGELTDRQADIRLRVPESAIGEVHQVGPQHGPLDRKSPGADLMAARAEP